jgi:peptide/nickel transport system substrate-binding protein
MLLAWNPAYQNLKRREEMHRKTSKLGLGLLVLAASAYGAGNGEQTTTTTQEATGPQYGGTLTVMVNGGAQAGDSPALSIMDANYQSLPWLDWVQEHPVVGDTARFGPRGTGESNFHTYGHISSDYLKGLLLESWEIDLDKAVFHVRPGMNWAADHVDFMDNREFTADDMVADMRLFAFESPWKGRFDGMISDIYSTDRYTVVIEFDNFAHTFLYFIGYEDRAKISPPETEAAGSSEWANQVGTGPFMFEEYVIGSHGTFVRNPNYWDSTTIDGVEYELPFVDKVTVPIIPDESTRVAALNTGQIDVYRQVPLTHWDSLDSTVPDLINKPNSIGSVGRIVLRVDIPPFDNLEVRRAMMKGLDIRKFQEIVRAPAEPLHVWPVHPDHSTYVALDDLPADIRTLYDYDPAEAKQMLAAAGYPNGFDTTYLHSPSPAAENQAALLKDQWAKIGVNVEITQVDDVTWADLAYPFPAPKWEGMRPDGTMTSDPAVILGAIMREGDAWNYSMYSNPDMEALHRQASLELDLDARNEIFSEGMLLTMRDLASIPLASSTGRSYWWPWVKNYFGEVTVGDDGMFSGLAQFIWIDETLKESMGF